MSIRIGRTRDVTIIDKFLEHLVHEDDQDPKAFLALVKSAVEHTPEKILVLAAMRGEDLVGFSITFDLKRDHNWIAQFWMDSSTGQKVTDEMFLRVLNWTIALGKKEIRAETQRSVEAFYRRVGFETHATTVKLDLKDIEAKLLDRAREVFKDG